MENAGIRDWTSHIEFMVLLTTLIGGFYLLDGKIETQSARTDRIYEMFCQQQKEFDQKFYDLLKEGRK